MEVILQDDVPNLGTTGEIVKVRPGFARNYLLPRGLAVVADHRNVRLLEHQKRIGAEKREKARKSAQSLAQRIDGMRLTFEARVGEEGKLFGSITNLDIEKSLAAAGVGIDRRRIRLAEPIKSVGEHAVAVHLGAGVDATVTVVVEPEGGAAAESA